MALQIKCIIIQMLLFLKVTPEVHVCVERSLTQRAAAACCDQNKAARGSYRQPVGQAEGRVHGTESPAAEHRVQPVQLLKRRLLCFSYKTQKYQD